jgi:hypothetical protein
LKQTLFGLPQLAAPEAGYAPFAMSPKAGMASVAMAAVIACAGMIAGPLASPAAAFHVPGAGYSGAVSGGGTISFSVSGDGSSVTNLTLSGVHTGNCTLGSKQYSQPIPITNNSFDNGEVNGSFPNVQGAYGHFSIVVFALPTSCRVAGTWSAITTADPAGSEECRSALAQLRKRKRALTKAKRTGSEAKIATARAKWRKARSRRDEVC